MCVSWRETSCGTNIRTPSQDLPCDAVVPGNTNGANSGYCECTFGNAGVVFGCGDSFTYTTCNAACDAENPTTMIEEVMRTVEDAMDDENGGEFH